MIRLANLNEALEIINEPQIVARTGIVVTGFSVHPFIVDHGKYKMLFTIEKKDSKTAEIHIACPKNSIIKSRFLANEIFKYAFNIAGYNRIITYAPKGKIANMAIKIGMTEFKKESKDKIWFEIKKTSFKKLRIQNGHSRKFNWSTSTV